MTQEQMFAALEAALFVREHNGGGTQIYRNGGVVVSGADGDLPAPHWFAIGVYHDWMEGEREPAWLVADWSAEPSCIDLGGPRDFAADLAQAMQLEDEMDDEKIAGASDDEAAIRARFRLQLSTADDARWLLAEERAAVQPCGETIAHLESIIAKESMPCR